MGLRYFLRHVYVFLTDYPILGGNCSLISRGPEMRVHVADGFLCLDRYRKDVREFVSHAFL